MPAHEPSRTLVAADYPGRSARSVSLANPAKTARCQSINPGHGTYMWTRSDSTEVHAEIVGRLLQAGEGVTLIEE